VAGGAKQAGFVAWLVALLVPPVVAGGLGQRFVAHHVIWAVVIGVVYEAAVAIGGFLAVILRDVLSRWQELLTDRIDTFLRRKIPRFERAYRRFVLVGLQFMDHKGLATVGPFTPELDAVFVNVTLVPRPPQKIRPGILPALADEQAGRQVLEDFLGCEKPAVLALVGSPGSGKTTLLRHAARRACLRKRSNRSRRGHVRDIPILLYLRDHAAAITADPAISVASLVRTTLGAMGADEPPGWFEQQLRNERCLVLLDGLDEVARMDDRAKVSAWAEGQVRQYPGNDFVISSRPGGYQSAPVEGARILQVCGFTVGQVEDFVRAWYQAVERHSTKTSGPEVEALAAEGTNDLIQRLEQTPALYDLTVNPLLLTMIVNVHKYRGALPGRRADLYSEICQVMLGRRQDVKHLPQPMTGDKKEVILSKLAYKMMKGRVSDLGRADILATIQPALRRISRNVTPDGFLADVSSNGLLIERETGQYAFAHKTFQEYLSAAHIRENGLVSDLADAVNDDWWAETTLLYAATANTDPIIQACLDANTAPALALALDCTDGDNDVDPDLLKRVNDLVISAASPGADQERRRMFAGILLARYMRQRKRTTGGTQVCAQPVPAEIYRLFLADTLTPEPDAPLVESGIAVGMRSSDAAEFVQWANALSEGQPCHRLPSAAEVTEFSAQQRIPALPSGHSLCPWIHDDGTPDGMLPVLWLPPGTPEPYALNSTLLADACAGDMTHSAFALNGIMARSRIVMGALTHDRDLDLDLAFHLDLNHARDHARALAQHLDTARNLDEARDLAVDLARTLDRAPDIGTALDRGLDLAFNLAVKIDQAADRHTHPTIDSTCRWILGRALSDATAESLRLNGAPDGWTARFAAAFIGAGGVSNTGYLTASPAIMVATLRESVKKLEVVLRPKQADMPTVSSWSSAVAEHLRRRAEMVFAGVERPTPEKATAIRLAALSLAAEADAVKCRNIGDMFRQLAAGITLLEYRATGELRAAEVIMLAVERSTLKAELPIRHRRSQRIREERVC
jgi:hypothetical protein